MSIVLNPAEDDDFMTYATQVVTGEMKYVLPVPTDRGEALVYPKAVTDEEKVVHPKGEIITKHGEPLGGDGVVVFNSSEGIYQAGVRGKEEGERAVIIINHVTIDQAELLDRMLMDLTKVEGEYFGSDPETLTFDNFKKIEAYARSLGLTNMYDSSAGRIQDTMLRVGTQYGVGSYGHMKRNDALICYAVRTPDAGELIRDGQTLPFAAGSFIVREGTHYHVLTPEDFSASYRYAAGDGAIDLDKISTFTVAQKPGPTARGAAKFAAN